MKKIVLLCIILSTSVALLLAQPNEFDFTLNNVTHGVIATVEVNGIPASNSDWIAAFDEDNNCAGAVQLLDYYSEAFCYLRVYGDDITTYNIDEGINTGETFTFKLWIAATNEILDHPTDIDPVSGWDAGSRSNIPGFDIWNMMVLNFSRDAEVDQDMDGFFGTDDPDDTDPCNPDNTVAACDTDGDGIPDGNDPPDEFAFTPNNQYEGVIATVEINGVPASDSDYIAAFDEDGNCAGAIQLLEYYDQAWFNLQVYGDDITTTDVDEGINAGETFTFKLWVAATNEILDHPINIDPVSGWDAGWSAPIPGFGFADEVVLNFTKQEAICTQTINLNAGWNLISLDVSLNNFKPTAENIFGRPLQDNLELVIGFYQGAIVYRPCTPPNIDIFFNIKDGFGYWVKVENADVLIFEGTCLTNDFRKPLDAGWNLIAYPPDEPQSPETYFADLISSDNLEFVSSFIDGKTKIFDPNLPSIFNTLTQLENGRGYWIKVTNAVD